MGVRLILVLLVLPIAYAATSIEQYGITWQFDDDYQTGQFANGDYWVLGPVTITQITPDATSEFHDLGGGICTGFSAGVSACSEACAAQYPGLIPNCDGPDRDGNCICAAGTNGWESNPIVEGPQAFQSGCSGGSYDPRLMPNLPYTAQGGESLVKTIPSGMERPCIQTASVLTVVDEIPPGNGAEVFRPPYAGTEKPYYYVSDIRLELPPSLGQVEDAKGQEWVRNRYQKVQLDHKEGVLGRSLHPAGHMPDYGGDIGRDNGDAVLQLFLDDPIEDKMQGLVNFIQYGIDLHYMYRLGHRWGAGGGHRPGQLLPLAFAAVMLDDPQMKSDMKTIEEDGWLHEQATLWWSENQQRALWGYYQNTDEEDYWNRLRTENSGAKSMRDIYDYIDGGYAPGQLYQACCTSLPWRGEALAFNIMPELKGVWNDSTFFEYVDRWVNEGTITQPDPCAPVSQGGGHDYTTGFCILDPDLEYFNSPTDFACKEGEECGRYPELHGTNANGVGRDSIFQREMWNAYRNMSCVQMSLGQLMAHMNSWKTGTISISQLMGHIQRWKHGC